MSALIQRPTIEVTKLVTNENGPFVSPIIQLPRSGAYDVYASGSYAAGNAIVEWSIDQIEFIEFVQFNNFNTPGVFYATQLDDSMFLRVTLQAGVIGATIGIR